MEPIYIIPGVHQESIRSVPGVQQDYQDSIRTPDGVHQDLWGSVTYRNNGPGLVPWTNPGLLYGPGLLMMSPGCRGVRGSFGMALVH